MLLRAFSSGAVALSGVEAVSNGVPAFQRPESEERRDHADVHGRHPRQLLPRRVDPRRHISSRTAARRRDGLGLMAEYIYGGKGALFWMTQIGHVR